MPAKRLSMRKLKEVLRLRFEHELSDRAIGRSCSISHRTAAEYVHRFYLSGLSWPLPGDLDDKSLEEKLFPEKTSPSSPHIAQEDVAKSPKALIIGHRKQESKEISP